MSEANKPPDDYKALLEQLLLDDPALVRATFSGRPRESTYAFTRVTLRPVLIRERRHVQFTYYDGAKAIVKNYAGSDRDDRVRELLSMSFTNSFVETTDRTVQVNLTRAGRAITKINSVHEASAPHLAHDRVKKVLLPAQKDDAYLKAVGIMAANGCIKPTMYAKYRQVNEFLTLIAQTVKSSNLSAPLKFIVDLGCGNAYLTFALYHYWRNLAGLPIEMCGVDTREEPIRRNVQKARDLGWQHLTFEKMPISAFAPERRPDMVVSLHACDTATDEAIAEAIQWESRFVFCVPCCHHDVQAQLAGLARTGPLQTVYRNGVLAERLGDVVTDAIRAVILRILGYRSDVVQFVTLDHTAKNLMIRAIRSGPAGDPAAVEEYRSLVSLLPVSPRLAILLGDRFDRLVA
jgi:hypothetical protein